MKKIKYFFVELVVIKRFLRKNMKNIYKLCQINKPMILMPSQNKYFQFKNLKNTIQQYMQILKVL